MEKCLPVNETNVAEQLFFVCWFMPHSFDTNTASCIENFALLAWNMMVSREVCLKINKKNKGGYSVYRFLCVFSGTKEWPCSTVYFLKVSNALYFICFRIQSIWFRIQDVATLGKEGGWIGNFKITSASYSLLQAWEDFYGRRERLMFNCLSSEQNSKNSRIYGYNLQLCFWWVKIFPLTVMAFSKSFCGSL